MAALYQGIETVKPEKFLVFTIQLYVFVYMCVFVCVVHSFESWQILI